MLKSFMEDRVKKLYNTYVISIDTFKAVRVLASNAGVDEAQDAERAGSKDWNTYDYFIQSYLVGSERDLECKKDMKKVAKVMA